MEPSADQDILQESRWSHTLESGQKGPVLSVWRTVTRYVTLAVTKCYSQLEPAVAEREMRAGTMLSVSVSTMDQAEEFHITAVFPAGPEYSHIPPLVWRLETGLLANIKKMLCDGSV